MSMNYFKVLKNQYNLLYFLIENFEKQQNEHETAPKCTFLLKFT